MEKIRINKKVIEKSNVVQLTNDIIVPDIKPDIINVITSNGVPYLYKCTKENNRIKVDGSIDCHIVYLSVDGDTRSIQTTLNFSDILDNLNLKEDSYFKYEIKIDTLEAKVLNERKISLNIKIIIKYVVNEICDIDIKDDFLSQIPTLQKREECIKINSLVGINSSKASIKEEMKVENLDEIAEILNFKINVLNTEKKISYNKILVKAEAEIIMVYITEDGRVGKCEKIYPLMSFVEMENVKEDNKINLEYNIKNLLVKLNNNVSSISVQVDFEVLCEVFEEREFKVLKDAYSLDKNLNIKYKKLELEENKLEEIFEINDTVKVEDIKNIILVEDRNINIYKTGVNLEGEIILNIYYETTNKLGLNCREIKLPFIRNSKVGNVFEINSIETSLVNENINFSIKLLEKIKNENSTVIEMIEDIEMTEEDCRDNYGMVIYVVKNKDTIWEIAKKFKVSVEDLLKLNDLEDENNLENGKKMYIFK